MSTKEQDKIEKLRNLYDLTDPRDLFTLIPQEMEVAEVKAMQYGWDGETKKEEVVNIIYKVAVANGLAFDKDIVGVFVDVINAASKGKYALNKG